MVTKALIHCRRKNKVNQPNTNHYACYRFVLMFCQCSTPQLVGKVPYVAASNYFIT